MNKNLILKTASDVNLSIKSNGDLNQIFKKIDKFEPKNNNEFLKLSEDETELLKITQVDLNQLKKIKMIIQMLRLGVKVSNFEDLKKLKEKKIESLIDINEKSLSKIQEIYILIDNQNEILNILKNKDNKSIVEQYKLMPPTTYLIFFYLGFIILSIITSYLGFSYLFLKDKYSFFTETSAFWTMLAGGLIFIISIYYFFLNIFIKIRQIKDKDKIIDELASNYFDRRENKTNRNIFKLRKKLFEIERKSIRDASILKLKQFLVEENNLLSSLRKNFILQ